MKKYYLALTLICILAVLAIGLNISVSKGPAGDNARVKDLDAISTAVEAYATKHDALPTNLAAVELTADIKTRVGNYEYKRGLLGKYQLCATFATDTTKSAAAIASGNNLGSSQPEYHKKGFACTDYESYGLGIDSSSSTPSFQSQSTPAADMICATKILPDNVDDYGSITKIDTKAGTITTDTGSYHWALSPAALPVYDSNCKVTTLAALKVGTDVDVVHSATGVVQAVQIY